MNSICHHKNMQLYNTGNLIKLTYEMQVMNMVNKGDIIEKANDKNLN
jgi:hypothetical protein